MRVLTGIDDLTAAVGEHLGYSDWLLVDQARLDGFAAATGSSDYLAVTLVPLLSAQVHDFRGFSMGVNYGCDRIRFPAPLSPGARVRAGVELTAVDPFGAGVQVRTTVTIEREHADRPVCVAETIAYLVP